MDAEWEMGVYVDTQSLGYLFGVKDALRALLKGLCAIDSCPKWSVCNVSCLERWQVFCHLPKRQLTGISWYDFGRSRNRRGRFADCEIICAWCSELYSIGNIGNICIEEVRRNNNFLWDSTLHPSLRSSEVKFPKWQQADQPLKYAHS